MDIFGHDNNGRKYQHYHALINNKHFNQHLQAAWNKYGEENFEFIIIEYNIPENQLLVVEQKYLDIAKLEQDKCYNKSFVAGRVEMTLEVRQKISKTKSSPEFRKKFASQMMGKDNPNYGNGDAIRGNKNPFYGKKHTQEAKRKMSEQRSGKNNYGYDFKTYTFYNEKTKEKFTGTRQEFYHKYNLNDCNVSSLISGRYKSFRKWILIQETNQTDQNLQ